MIEYALDNAHPVAKVRLDCLSALYDHVSRDALARTALRPGASFLELGAGNGSVAQWAVECGARVTAVDADTRWLDVGPVVDVLTIDLRDLGVTPGRFDVIHARLTLSHLAHGREKVLERLVAGLRPGGHLVVSELDPIHDYCPWAASDDERLINRVGKAFGSVLDEHGHDLVLGCRFPALAEAAGLVGITTWGHTVMSRSPVAPAHTLMRANAEQTHDSLIATNWITGAELRRYLDLLAEGHWFLMPNLITTVARRPEGLT